MKYIENLIEKIQKEIKVFCLCKNAKIFFEVFKEIKNYMWRALSMIFATAD